MFFISLASFAQKQGNIWFFGDHDGIDFNSGVPISISGGQTYLGGPQGFGHCEGTSSICDSSGALLFYTNGEKVWNRIHQLMPNGDSLLGHFSSTQSSLIVPEPGSDNIFYLFTTDSWFQDDLRNGFRFSKIDMCLDNHLGDVISNEKNILILDTVCEKLTAVKHMNGIDYWIIVHKYYSDKFYAYKLTNNGITDTIITPVGSIHDDNCVPYTNNTAVAIGQMKASPNGSKLALATLNTCKNLKELFDFDKSTGVVSNFIDLELSADTIWGGYGVSFSLDNSKLYFSAPSPGKIWQYNLDAGGGNSDSIRSSKCKIADLNSVIYGLQLGPDGKIYVAREINPFVAVIDNPNANGQGCNFIDSAVFLNGISSYGMPNMINSYNNSMVHCTDGVEENLSNIDFYVYSNLTTEDIVFKFANWTKANLNINIFDCTGKLVSRIDEVRASKVDIDTFNWRSGLYYFQIISNVQQVITGKIIVE